MSYPLTKYFVQGEAGTIEDRVAEEGVANIVVPVTFPDENAYYWFNQGRAIEDGWTEVNEYDTREDAEADVRTYVKSDEPTSEGMNITEFAAQLLEDYPDVRRCYIAVMKNDGQFDLEVEAAPHETIIGVYRLETDDFYEAQISAATLDSLLRFAGVCVVATREEWENQPDDAD